jgi:hypothetical protein
MTADDRATSRLDPRWIAPIYKATSGQDFLGLRAVQGNIVGYLLPGVISITPRARYYPFYCWLLVEYGQSHPEGMSLAAFIRRREQIFVLANLAWSALSDVNLHEGGLLGSTKLGSHWQSHRQDDLIPLSVDRYLQAQYGGYGQYAGVMTALGLIRAGESDFLDVLPKGQGLAHAFADAVRDTRYFEQRRLFDTANRIPRDTLEEYGIHCHMSGLATGPDRLTTQEALFAFDGGSILPPPQAGGYPVGNMKGTLGLILDMLDQAKGRFTEDAFRRAAAFGLCGDYEGYRPSRPLVPMLAHWQMYQIREYYVYGLYALWLYFLYWLRLEGPQTSDAFYAALSEEIDLSVPAAVAGVDLPARSPREWILKDLLVALLDAAGVAGDDFGSRCRAYALTSSFPLNEHALYVLLRDAHPEDPSTFLGSAWLLLATLSLRLRGLRDLDQWKAWYWAQFGGARRRSMDLFLRDMGKRSFENVLDVWAWIYRDYVVAQHTITALEKWRQRNANTFHFNYNEGLFEWVRDGENSLTTSRFPQAYTMLSDLGMYELLPEEDNRPRLTELGRKTLQRVLEDCDG